MKKQNVVFLMNLKKTIKTTMIIIILLIGSLPQLGANNYVQNKTISISVKNGSLAEVCDKIEKQSEFLFFYDMNRVDKTKKISIKKTNSTVDKVLDDIVTQANLKYTIKDRHIVLAMKDTAEDPLMSVTQASLRTIAGTVRDETGESIVGASVVVKGTKNGAITGLDGDFTIKE